MNMRGELPFWRSIGYVAWFTADTASAIGLALRALAISLLGYALSGSTVAAGWMGSLSMIAQQGMSVFGGTFVDRHDRRAAIVANSVTGTLAWGIVGILLSVGRLSFPVLLAISVIASGVNGFLGSATDAMLRSIIDVRDYPQARSLNEGRDATINMMGNPIGGFLYSVRPWLPFLIAACAYAMAGASAMVIRKREDQTGEPADGRPSKSGGSFFQDLIGGWSWFLHKRMLVVVVVAASLTNFGVNGIQYAIQLHLVSAGTNATLIGLISAGISLAMLVGSALAGKFGGELPVGTTVCVAFVFMCVCVTPMMLTDDYRAILIANSLMGLPFPVINALLLGFVFAKSPQDMQGRITVTLTVPAQTLSAFCGAAAGTLLPVLGFPHTVLVFSLTILASTLIVACSSPIRRIPRAGRWGETRL
ncbi:MFS transporter [Bifidobacterium aesculapii]|uniref:MFS transporter n=1 Tax=Bifidobacterium aesculapii TaxID=1329411 RepID=UPI000AD82379|nr:MFS transporter [Bifidobacterium aesculapii]